jgi:hypothetical protein
MSSHGNGYADVDMRNAIRGRIDDRASRCRAAALWGAAVPAGRR